MRTSPYQNEAYTTARVFRLKDFKISNKQSKKTIDYFGIPADYKKSSDFERYLADRLETE